MTSPPSSASPAPPPAALRQLEMLRAGEMDLGLERVAHVAHLLDLPLRGRKRPLYALVGGTNGKGTVAWGLSGLLEALGALVVRFTSPHLVDPRERVTARGGQWIDLDAAEELARDVLRAAERAGEPLTWFEGWTLLALSWAHSLRADVAVLEVGLGGRLDAVNIVEPDVSVLTHIALDHTEHLGESLEEIAREKAAIARDGRPLVAGVSGPLLREALGAVHPRPLDVLGVDFSARREGARWVLYGSDVATVELTGPDEPGDCVPAWMATNRALALRAAWRLDSGAGKVAAGRVLATHRPPCRFQCFRRDGVPYVADGAHNPDGARALAASLARLDGRRIPTAAVVAVRGTKDAAGILGELGEVVDAWWFATMPSASRGWWEPETLASHVRGATVRAGGDIDESVAGAHAWAREHNGRVLLTGSLYFLGELCARGVVPCPPTGTTAARPSPQPPGAPGA